MSLCDLKAEAVKNLGAKLADLKVGREEAALDDVQGHAEGQWVVLLKFAKINEI